METEHCNRCDPSPQQADARAPTQAARTCFFTFHSTVAAFRATVTRSVGVSTAPAAPAAAITNIR